MPKRPYWPPYPKWLGTGLLEGLDTKTAFNLSIVLENSAQYLLRQFAAEADRAKYPEEDINLAANILFPILRRVLASDNLEFTWSASPSPAFVTECGIARTHTTQNIRMRFTPSDKSDLCGYSCLDVEVEFTAQIADSLVEEFNRKFKGKHVVFYTPIVAMGKIHDPQENKDHYGLATRCCEFPKEVHVQW